MQSRCDTLVMRVFVKGVFWEPGLLLQSRWIYMGAIKSSWQPRFLRDGADATPW